MLRESDLGKIRQVRYRDGDSVTLDTLESQLLLDADNYAIPIAFGRDQVQYGRGRGAPVDDCMVIYHPMHKEDYNHYIVVITRQGRYAFVNLYSGGNSKLGGVERAKDMATSGNPIATFIGAKRLVGSAFRGDLFGTDKRYAEEHNWHTMIEDVLDAVFGE